MYADSSMDIASLVYALIIMTSPGFTKFLVFILSYLSVKIK